MKPRYRKKGKYTDGRSRYIVEWLEQGKMKSIALPKPEEMMKILGCPDTEDDDYMDSNHTIEDKKTNKGSHNTNCRKFTMEEKQRILNSMLPDL